MKWLWLVFSLLAITLPAQTPINTDSVTVNVMKKYYTASPNGPTDPPLNSLVCLYGVVDSSGIFVDSAKVEPRCDSKVSIGALGYSHQDLTDAEVAQQIDQFCSLLKKRNGFHIAGVIHGITLNNYGHRVPMIWACWMP